jgi:NAD(P)-dependent dehydrogenase (short-subunit alcohol dehydrogenase family)
MHTTPQAPIGSGFDAATTAAAVIKGIDLAGKTVVVTGGYSGIGVETVRAFRSAGARVFVPTRDREKARMTLADMPDVAVAAMDLFDPASIDSFAEWFLRASDLGHFQLTCRLWPALVRAQGARVIALSSFGHRRAGIDFRDPNFERRKYDPWEAYGQAKTANSLFAVALDSIGQRQGVRAFAVHPGGIMTDLVRHMSKADLAASNHIDAAGKPIIDPYNNKKTPQQGAATSVWCATSPRLDGMGGVYCADCEIARELPSDDSTELHGVRPRAIDPVAAGRLWTLSEQLTSVTLG